MTSSDQWIKIDIDKELLAEANSNVKKYNLFNLFGGAYAQKLAGEVGRLALRKYLTDNKIEFSGDTHIGSKDEYDFIINNKNISLKTQLVNYSPSERWRCEVNEKQLENPCDYHLFIKAFLKDNLIWIVGCIKKSRFDREGILRKKGDIMKDNFTEWEVKETKKDISITELEGVEVLLEFKQINPKKNEKSSRKF